MRTRSRTPQSGRAEDAERKNSAMSKMLKRRSSAEIEDAGLSNPDLGQKHAAQALTPDRMTPARYRFSAAVADSAYHASTNNGPCLEITPALRCRTSLALMHRRPRGTGRSFDVRAKVCICWEKFLVGVRDVVNSSRSDANIRAVRIAGDDPDFCHLCRLAVCRIFRRSLPV